MNQFARSSGRKPPEWGEKVSLLHGRWTGRWESTSTNDITVSHQATFWFESCTEWLLMLTFRLGNRYNYAFWLIAPQLPFIETVLRRFHGGGWLITMISSTDSNSFYNIPRCTAAHNLNNYIPFEYGTPQLNMQQPQNANQRSHLAWGNYTF